MQVYINFTSDTTIIKNTIVSANALKVRDYMRPKHVATNF